MIRGGGGGGEEGRGEGGNGGGKRWGLVPFPLEQVKAESLNNIDYSSYNTKYSFMGKGLSLVKNNCNRADSFITKKILFPYKWLHT